DLGSLVVAQGAGHVAEEEERDDLEDTLAVVPAAVVPVLDIAELLDQLGVDAGLLSDFAQRRVGALLAVLDVTLRQGARGAVLHEDGRQVRLAAHVADDQAAGRELADHAGPTSGTKRTGTSASWTPSRMSIRCSRPRRRIGITSGPCSTNCASSASGGAPSAVAVTLIASNGARSATPSVPSPTRVSTLL